MVPSGKCSQETVRRRSNKVFIITERLSIGDTTVQMRNGTKAIPKEERENLMKEAKFTVTIPPEQDLAMKADRNIPWNKIRVMRRYAHMYITYTLTQL